MALEKSESRFDIGQQQVAAVYAKAFLGAAENTGQIGALVAELQSLVGDVLEKFPDFDRLLKSALLAHDKKLGMLDRVLRSRASELLVVFLKVLSAHGRLDCLRAIARQVTHRFHEMQGRVEVHVRTACPLSDSLRDEIGRALQRILGAQPLMRVQLDPALLGGLVVSVGDTVYDGSIATRLARLRTQMIERSVQQIETNRERFLEGNWEK